MKKIIAIFCIFAFLIGEEKEGDLKSIDGKNAPIPEVRQEKFLEGWGKFVKVGIGPVTLEGFNDSFFGFSTSAGLMMYPQEDFQHLFSLDFDYVSLSDWYKKAIFANPRLLNSIQSNGNSFDLTLNYGTSDKLFSSGIWNVQIVSNLGIGIRHNSLNIKLGNLENSDNGTSFIIKPSITLRSIVERYHALDFTVKFDTLVATKTETRFFLNNWYFYFSYVFLSF